MKHIKDNNYITIPAIFRTQYNLNCNEVIIASIIYGFSQDGKSSFTGSLAYLQEWTSLTKQGILKILAKLVNMGIIEKEVSIINGVRHCAYKTIIRGGKLSLTGVNSVEQGGKLSLIGGGKLSLHNNKKNNIDNENIDIPTNVGITHAHEAEENQPQVNTKTKELDSTMIEAAAGTPYGKFLSWLKDKAPYCYKNLQLPTEAQFNTLVSKYGSEKVANTVLTIENRKDYRKKYVNLYLTVNNWLRRDEEKTNKQ